MKASNISPSIFPPVLDTLVDKTKESGYILALVKLLLHRLNSHKGVKASVTSFEATCGGGFPPSLSEIVIVAKTDGPKGVSTMAVINMYDTVIENDPKSIYDGHTPPTTVQDEYISGRAVVADGFVDEDNPRIIPFKNLEWGMLESLSNQGGIE